MRYYNELRKEAVKLMLDNLGGDYDKKLPKHLSNVIDEFVDVLTKYVDDDGKVCVRDLEISLRTNV